jgi:tetratricopeptide (TPR) repeat protein
VHIRLKMADTLWENDQSAAETNFRKALELQSSLVRRFPRNYFYQFELAVINESLARFFQDHDRLPEARTSLQDSIALFKGILENDPKAGPLRGVLAHNYMNLSDLLRRAGDEKAAEEAAQQAQKFRPDR